MSLLAPFDAFNYSTGRAIIPFATNYPTSAH